MSWTWPGRWLHQAALSLAMRTFFSVSRNAIDTASNSNAFIARGIDAVWHGQLMGATLIFQDVSRV